MTLMLLLDDSQELSIVVIGLSFCSYLLLKKKQPKRITDPLGITLVIGGPLTLATLSYFVSSFLGVFVTVASYFGILTLLAITYRTSPIHPLANYPGPALSKVSKLWAIWVLWRGKQHLVYKELHELYGDVVRVGPNELSIRHADAVQSTLALPKGPFWDNRSDPPSLIATRDLAVHAQKRRRWNRAFNSAALKDYEETIREKSKEFVESLGKRVEQEIDLNEWMSYFTFDFMGVMAFGRDFGMVKGGSDNQELSHLIEGAVLFETMIAHVPWAVPIFHRFPFFARAENRLVAFGVTNVEHRISAGSNRRDLFHFLIDEDGLESVKPSKGTVISDALVSIIAGSDTTATALVAIFYYLLLNPHCQTRLRREIQSVFTNGEDPLDFTKLAHMSYLTGCINEALRLLPPLSSGAQKYISDDSSGFMAGPYFVPQNTAVFVHPFSLHRDARYFSPLPEVFWPDRWIPPSERQYPAGTSDADFILNTTAFIPFSGGPASCAGKSLAMMELRAITCILLHYFQIEIADTDKVTGWENTLRDYFTLQRGPLPVKLHWLS
ncbi:cytochrome P450 [Dendrothele bispora CBS 962.96]|uniref:Cytochrome P450 n=1 Tax=Dendrothele bispora (strain CBS 962.96) TaxID=1314807 RepID=A0A4S8KW52_DENBC|nr:cytochrome P450 [Dendrothele bispora CBS 962.96]